MMCYQTIRQWAILLLLIPAFGIATPAQSQSVTVYGSGGVGFPEGPDFGDFYDPGPEVMAGVGYALSSSIEVRALLHYSSFSFDTAQIDATLIDPDLEVGASGGDRRILGGTLGMRLNFTIPEIGVQPYIMGDVGGFRVDTEALIFENEIFDPEGNAIVESTEDETVTEPGVSFGVGLAIPATSRFSVTLEPRYTIVMTTGNSLRYGSIRAGVSYQFGAL